ncbi:hypothetical protein HBO32_26235 [Pseudomonas nitroreducens]|uniref:phage protein n=1 Tax=Pseudomonas aeruginosa group TaxID=136841 RepID=UPI0014740D88|nr:MULTISPECIES: hypothetical protein [Pseudomonas aeruginosa group]NMZ76622.1 hypothetical protein [Pseudomonas nitroreducens]
MSTPQYLRSIKLTIGDNTEALDLSELRIRFAIRRGDISTPNSADIRVYNVSDKTAQLVQTEFTRVRLEAGYEGNFGVIFDGTVIQVRRGRESQTDTYLDITAADGDSAYNFAVVNTSLAAGATLDDQLGVCLKAMKDHGVTLGYAPPLPQQALPRGKVMFGMVRDYLDGITAAAAAKWSIQDGKLYIIPLGNYLPGEALPINAATGMVGLPEQTNGGINVKMLLNPSVKIGRLIRLNNSSIQQYRFNPSIKAGADNAMIAMQNKLNDDGLYYVMIANHSGDTRGNDWYTDTVCLAVDASVPRELLPSSTAADPVTPIKPFG